jgi:enoyl-CoA hydratase/carnithine racemase
MNTFSQIEYAVTDSIATITMQRPEKLNAFTPTMAREIVIALDVTDADDDVRVVVLTGAGKAFCAGNDIGRGPSALDPHNQDLMREREGFGTIGGVPRGGGGYLSLRIAAARKPVIAAINGAAVGVGATMTLPADIRIASDTARFGFVFARRGVLPEAASSWFLPRIVGISQAMEWVATGRVFGAEEARAGGLVSRVVPPDELLSTAYQLADEIAANTSAVSVSLSRQLMWSMLSADTPWEAHRIESIAMNRLGRSPEAAEGVASFLARRAPAFPGRTGDYADLVPEWPTRPPGI